MSDSENPTTNASETQAVADAYASLNRGDVAGFVQSFDQDIERIEFLGSPAGGTYRGLEAVRAHVERGRGTWAEGRCRPKRFFVAGERIAVFVHVHVRLHGATEWLEGDVGDVFTFRNGKVIQFRSFLRTQDALSFVGIEASDG